MNSKTAILELREKGYFVWDHFFDANEVLEISNEFQGLFLNGNFKGGGIGNQQLQNLNTVVRDDQTYWLNTLALTPVQTRFWNRLEELKQILNEALFLGLWNLDGHYSRYPVKGHYHQHLDRFIDDDTRTLSMVFYLNSHWKSEDGGALRLHFKDENPAYFDVTPLAGRLICFLSESIHHEVMITHEVRMSFAGWWKRRK